MSGLAGTYYLMYLSAVSWVSHWDGNRMRCMPASRSEASTVAALRKDIDEG